MSPASRPRLAARARLRADHPTGGTLLLWPERGLALSPTAADVAQLCTGTLTVAEIAARLAARYDDAAIERVERDVLAFLHTLEERGLVVEAG
jgi:coenzyme PQQ biosynthesis protein PqqD